MQTDAHWLCLSFPLLALNLIEQQWTEQQRLDPEPLVLEINRGNRREVHQANATAAAAGIRPGMALTTAASLTSQLQSLPYHADAEQRALQHLGHWAYQFTPHLQLQAPSALLLYIQPCLKLFGGIQSLLECVHNRTPVHLQPVHAACAPTPEAAWLFAQSHSLSPATDPSPLFKLDALQRESIRWLDITPREHEQLEAIGLRTIGELLALPQAHIQHRFKHGFSRYLRALQGKQQTPLPHWQLPDVFTDQITLLQEIEHQGALLFPIRILLERLQQYLQASQKAASELTFKLRLRNHKVQEWRLCLSHPAWECGPLLTHARLQLERLELTAPVTELALNVTALSQRIQEQTDLFSTVDSNTPDLIRRRAQLIDQLQARLGEKAVYGLNCVQDHRPEYSITLQTPNPKVPVQVKEVQVKEAHVKAPTHTMITEEYLRPAWLLPQPQRLRQKKGLPVHEFPLVLLQGPERIETGWWDQARVCRDYFIACEPNGRRLWVFRDYQYNEWFLHGFFAD